MLTHYLTALQDRLHLSDPEFAHEIGLDAETWQALRGGSTGYTPAIVARLLTHVPNAHALALEELRLQAPAIPLHILDGALAAPAVHHAEAAHEVPALAYAA